MKLIALSSLLLLLSANIYAADDIVTKLTRVGSTNLSDGIIIETENAPSTSCNSQKVFMKKVNNEMFSENLSILLSAFHANTNVRLYTEGCVDGHIGFKSVSVIK